jgi:RHS repeat-associated protein
MDSPETAKVSPKGAGQAVAPAISLPKGGGSVRGIGEKFGANPVTGTGTLSVPIAASPGRAGFGPQLSLSYDSGAGNGPFGFGWQLPQASITRKTEKCLPRYPDGGDLEGEESDVFILSGADDLVPVLQANGKRHLDAVSAPGYVIQRYRPRIEGLFARIERWTRVGSAGDVHWRSITRDNLLTIYGPDAESRIADPQDARRIFSWLICETRDDQGNGMRYRYLKEDGEGADLTLVHERNRGPLNDVRRTANRYLKRICYGNRASLLVGGKRPQMWPDIDPNWMFELVFDYGDHDPTVPATRDDEAQAAPGQPQYPWRFRADPFSSYRAGFEVRTTRLCQRVLMFHHFPGEPDVGRDCLVRSTDFTWSDQVDPMDARNPVYTFLRSVTQTGYRRKNAGYEQRSLPPVEFDYTEPVVQQRVQELDPDSLENLPAGMDGSSYRWIDLHGEGIPGILSELGGAWFYKRNLSPMAVPQPDGGEALLARFAPLEAVAQMPNVMLRAGAEFMDLAGDGQPDVVVMEGSGAGLYEHDDGEGWQSFRQFTHQLVRDTRDPNLRFIDLDGDGHADVLITEDDALVWHRSLAEEGFGPAVRVAQALDEERGPRVVFADGTQSIYLADLSGDGLVDIARIRNGEVCYWPNLGHGRFGAKVAMDNAPRLDRPGQFDQQRVRLADIDGSGTADIIYLHEEGVRLYFNQSGNGWSGPQLLSVFPRVDDLVNIVPIDLLGNGTACLVWSSPLAGDAPQPMRYVDLMGGHKPHLLARTANNLGVETRIDYAPSTKFYLQDKRDGSPWVTRLPFPVHVVERVETYDHVSRNRFVSRYAYHHGYFDGDEREFRGFGMVEQWDTEQFATFTAAGLPADNIAAASHVPPVHSKTWFHTGAWMGRDAISDYFAGLRNAADQGEYFREPGLTDTQARALLLTDTTLPAGLSLAEEREACRALKGSMLRQEVYADDAGPAATPQQLQRARTPYTVAEQNFTVRMVQARGPNRHAVFFVHPCESLSYHYERDPADPRVDHQLTLEVDAVGNVLKHAAIGYGRRAQIRIVDGFNVVQQVPNPGLAALHPADQAKQTTALLTFGESRFPDGIDTADAYRHPPACEKRDFELTGYPATGPAGRFKPSDLVEPDPSSAGRLRNRFSAPEVAYEATAAGSRRRRLIEWRRTLFRRDDLSGLLPLGAVEPLALPGESYRLAFTPGLLGQVFVRPRAGQAPEMLLSNPAAVLAGQAGDSGGYVPSQTLKADGRFPASDADDHWWIPSGRTFFSGNPADSPAGELAQARQHFFLVRRHRDAFAQDAFADFDADDLLLVETRDALGNRITAEANDYRVLQPCLVSDPNRNRTEVAFDTLGLVAGTAVMGKPAPAPAEGDSLIAFASELSLAETDGFFIAVDPHAQAPALLQRATTRNVYDLDRFSRTRQANPDDPAKWEPARTATLARETHFSAPLPPQGLKIQLHFSYSDGFGREIQKKIQAEPGPVVEGGPVVGPRWVASGWTIFNNKGKPVRQYEPFFSATPGFEFGVVAGLSAVRFYDPTGRVVATLHPNHTFDKVVFDPWLQATYDVNDTCAPGPAPADPAKAPQTGDPRTDPDIGGHVAGYFSAQPAGWQTWRAQRIAGALGAHEQAAAIRAAAHADTPTTAHLDALGRTFLTVERNRVVCAGHDLDGTSDTLSVRVELDIEGKERAVRDAIEQAGDPLGRVVVRYSYDMLGNRIFELGMDGGARWTLNGVDGTPIRAWDSRGHNFTTAYDALRRPVEQTVRGTFANAEAASDPRTLNRDILVEKIDYGEGLANAAAFNLRSRAYRHFDSAGLVTNARLDANADPAEAFDFKGNLLHSTRRLASAYKDIPDWRLNPQLDAEFFESSTRYDALNRPVQSIAPRASHAGAKCNISQPVFNEANLLERLDVWLDRATSPAGLLDPDTEAPSAVGVANVDYDAKGQRQRIDYKNGASTFYGYDPLNFRLTRLSTRRSAAAFPGDDPQPPVPGWPGRQLQNLSYTYDPAGNVSHILDEAQQTVYFRNQRVEPSNDYVYDALYRLIQAQGREHLGQGGAPIAHSHDDGGRTGLLSADAAGRFSPNDGSAMGTYVERYVYDAVGNLLKLQHRGSDPSHPGWSRGYAYAETSTVEDGTGGLLLKNSNRLTSTSLDPDGASPPQLEPYTHDAHGNMVRMPHLGAPPGPNMHWDYKDRLHQVDLGGGGSACYVYDASGTRVRNVWEKAPGLTQERIYLGSFEIFRKHGGAIGANTATLERETLHLMDDRQRLALVETRTLDTAAVDLAPARLIRYQFGNHLGSAGLELDEDAQIISYEEYAPYGSSTYQAVRSQTETAKRYRFTGKERDEETGLSYHVARYYAPWLCRWTSADPIGLQAGMNVYCYVRCNPARLIDLDGTQEAAPEQKKELGFFQSVGIMASVGFTLATGQTPSQFGSGMVDKAKSITVDPVMTLYGPGGMIDKAAQKLVDKATGNQHPDSYYVTPAEHSKQLHAIVAVGSMLLPPVEVGGGGFAGPALATPEGVVLQAPAVAAPGVTVSGPLVAGGVVLATGGGGQGQPKPPPKDPAPPKDPPGPAVKKYPEGQSGTKPLTPTRVKPSNVTAKPTAGPAATRFNESALADVGMNVRNALKTFDEEHHLLVQQQRKWFASKGINIDEYTVTLTWGEHSAVHSTGWNQAWTRWISANREASAESILAKMAEMRKQFGLEGNAIHPYTR